MGSIGASTVINSNDYFNGVLGPRNSMSSIERLENAIANWSINPEYYSDSKGYDNNCALVSTAAALYAMGYDVEAMPRDTIWRGFDSVFEVDYSNPDNYIAGDGASNATGIPRASLLDYKYDNVSRMPRGAKAASKAIIEKVESWGSGAVGVMNVKWKDTSSAHVVNLFNKNGKVVAHDFQSNKEIPDLEKIFKADRSDINSDC